MYMHLSGKASLKQERMGTSVAQLSEHPTVKRFYQQSSALDVTPAPSLVGSAWLRQVCLDAGADDINEVARRIVAALERVGVGAINGGAAGFPMEADRWGSKMWVISHKTVAVAAGLGQMGIHRNVIHPKFGNFVLLGTVLIDAQLDSYSHPIAYNPCLECKLCVAACPTGAISPE